ncbi:sugar ABC transporter permease [Paracoccus sp. S-4012]|uniref:ABC transporter permease n=1 Tax=Paracoccus sp. S-4012 TaxID=2665648 RepID=UPI0012AF7B64|nr:ABC transporter permease [Paracoccus sp. S-4012]MRX49668.1 sugar ABC transporter permease [Paracoccus sp. S-4012]
MGRTIVALILREIATRYGRSPGGYLWEIAEPVAAIALLSMVFSATGMHPTVGTSFALFYATGFLPFSLYLDLSNTVARSVQFSRPFLQYPSVTYMDAILARAILNLLTQTTVFVIVLGGIDLLFGLDTLWNIPALAMAIAMMAAIGIAVGVLNCYLFMEFPVWERAWSILNRPMFLISGIFFTYGMMPASAQKVLWYNPIIHGVAMTRAGVYPAYDASYATPLYVFGVAIVVAFFGLLLLWRHHSRLLES